MSKQMFCEQVVRFLGEHKNIEITFFLLSLLNVIKKLLNGIFQILNYHLNYSAY